MRFLLKSGNYLFVTCVCCRSSDKLLKDYPCVIYMNHKHNHRITCADAMRFRRPNAELKDMFLKLFHKGHSPSSALQCLKTDLQEEFGLDYYKAAADGARCPNVQWAYHLYYSHFSKAYGSPNGEEMLKSLQQFIDEYNTSTNSVCAAMEMLDDQVVVAVATPLMKRVLTHLKSSGEIMFIDSGGCMDRHNSRVFLMLAPSVAGALPIGVLITSSESQPCISKALQIYKKIIPENSFAGRGSEVGPKIGMSDQSGSERGALGIEFPFITLLLCIFHVLQAMWKYLWLKAHKVLDSERTYIFGMFKECVYASKEADFEASFSKMLDDPVVSKNSTLTTHLEELRGKKHEWALCFRQHLLIRGHHTNNYSESNIRAMKDQVLNRTKAFSITQLFDYIVTKLDRYFERRITEVINNRTPNYTASRYFIEEKKLIPLSCQKISGDIYIVKNSEKGTEYVVDAAVELCSCPVGVGGALCKHLYKVVKTFNLTSTQVLPFADVNSKMNLFYILTGQQGDRNFFQTMSLQESNQSDNNSDHLQVSVDEAVISEDSESSQHDAIEDPDSFQDSCDPDTQDEGLDRLKGKLDSLSKSFLDRSMINPSLVLHIEKFVDRCFEECAGDSSLEHALATFNRYRGPKPSQSDSNKTHRIVRNCGGIPVNTSSVGRRQLPFSGRNSRITGRPPKEFRRDHGYNAAPDDQPSWKMPQAKQARAPQNLAYCVASNIRLGKNCGRKMS